MHLTSCELTGLLKQAKAAHSKLPKEVQEDPNHSWEKWYAGYIMDRLKELDMDNKWKALSAEPLEVAILRSPQKANWSPVNGEGPAPSCPPGPAQECSDAELYKEPSIVGMTTEGAAIVATDEQDGRFGASVPSPASGWR